jgi:hypothetical protein
MHSLFKSIQDGSQGRTFSQENYKALIESNKQLADKFILIGDSFYYLGDSMQELSNSLTGGAILLAQKAAT